MGKLSVLPRFVKPAHAAPSLYERRRINARSVCPWCGSEMYLDRAGERLLCADSIHCAGVVTADQGVSETDNKQIQKAVA